MAGALRSMADLLFPRVCHICGTRLAGHERFVCTFCLASLPRSGYHRRSMNPMETRFAGVFPFEKATGHFLYSRDSPLSVLVQDMKYRNFPAIGDMLGATVASELLPVGFFDGVDCICPVPMHFMKKARRGYNQAERIARGISKVACLPVVDFLKATRGHLTQTSMTMEQRRGNLSGIFEPIHRDDIIGKHVLLVDDICTTGSTIIAAGEALCKSDPSNISILTIGVTF